MSRANALFGRMRVVIIGGALALSPVGLSVASAHPAKHHAANHRIAPPASQMVPHKEAYHAATFDGGSIGRMNEGANPRYPEGPSNANPF